MINKLIATRKIEFTYICVHLVKWCTKLLDFPLLMLANMFQGKDTQQKKCIERKRKNSKEK